MDIILFKARDGVYDLFVDNEWKMSTKNVERIFVYLSDVYDNILFTYFDMNETIDKII